MKDQTILFSGLPESGKTTFIAALWYYIFNGTANDEYAANSLADTELEYLNTIAGNWAMCEQVIRTNKNSLEDVRISIKHNASGKIWTLDIPDLKGERFIRQFEFRQWDEDFERVLQEVDRLILFVDPRDTMNSPRLIFHENQHYRIFGESPPNVENNSSIVWTENLVPSQVKLVDYLQSLDYHRPGQIKKIAIVISCWDVLTHSEHPKEWCRKSVPLLYQYILANSDLFDSKFYGLTAQGGSYETEDSKDRLLQMAPLDRVEVTDGITVSKNILTPILWLTNDNPD